MPRPGSCYSLYSGLSWVYSVVVLRIMFISLPLFRIDSHNSLAARVVVFGCIPLALVGGGVQPLYFLRVSPIKP